MSVKAKDNRDGIGHIVWGMILLMLGIMMLLYQYDLFRWEEMWPLLIIVAGLVFIIGGMRRSRQIERNQSSDYSQGQ